MKFLSFLMITLFFSNVHVNLENQAVFELIVFEGSDWCTNCRRLEKQVLSDDDFKKYLDDENIKLTKIDFPQRKKLSKEQEETNKEYALKYQFVGVFPTIILSRIDTLSYRNLSYTNYTPEEFIRQIDDSLKMM